MNFARLSWNLIWKPIWIPFWSEAGHVALCDCSVPVRADRGCDPSDLMRAERPRFTRTRSLKWAVLERGIYIWRLGLMRGEPAHLARVPAWNHRRGRAGRWSPASSGGSWHWRTCGRCAEGLGEFTCVAVIVDCLQNRSRAPAGEVRDDDVIRVSTRALFHCEINQKEGISGCVGMQEEG
jgi:hypothetical protein